MLTVEEALTLILGSIRPLAPCPTLLEKSPGHVLAEDAIARLDLPPFANSAMDGFALHSTQLGGASPTSPVRLALVGEVKAGDSPSILPPGENCLRIMTGAPLPSGADVVVMKEETSVIAGEGGAVPQVLFNGPAPPGENVRPAGQDIARGQLAVPAGALIRPPEVAMLASLGLASVMAFPRPRVAILTTGDEVIPAGATARPGQIYNSNRYLLQALAGASNFQVTLIQHLPDNLEETTAALAAAAPGQDAIISTGGVSVGEYDHVRAALEKIGVIHFWGVAMKPGKPLAYGSIGECPFFGLPGNPVSSMVSFELFVRPALLRMAGHHKVHRARVRSRLLSPFPHRPGREEYARVMTTRSGDEFVSALPEGQASHMLSSMVAANSLAIIPAEAGSLPADARVDVLMTGWPEEN